MDAKKRSGTVYVGPGEGRTVRWPGEQLLTRKVGSGQTGGAYSHFEAAVRPGGGQALHIQHEEDECFYVLEGRFEFLIEGAKTEAVTGSLVYVPKGTLHAFENAGEATGKLLITQTPGGLHERLIEELGHAAEGQSAGGPWITERLAAIGPQFGVEVVSPQARTPPLRTSGYQEIRGKRFRERRRKRR